VKFEDAFREINGRAPSVDEVKHALAIRRVVREADLDPVLLFYLADAQATAERQRIPGEVKAAVDDGVKRLTAAVPSGGALAQAMGDARTVMATFDRLNQLLEFLGRWVTIAVFSAVIVTLVVMCVGWRGGYAAGWDASRIAGYVPIAEQVCHDLGDVRHDLRMHRADTEAIDRKRMRLGC